MGQLRIPEGADAAFRIVATDAFGCTFAINVYGAGRNGWFVASHRYYGGNKDSGVQQLDKGEWLTLLHFVDQCGFWGLPEDGKHLEDRTVEVVDGEWLSVAGRDVTRYHRIERFIWRERGLDAVLAFGYRVSGWFVRHPISGFWIPRGPSEAVTEPPADSG